MHSDGLISDPGVDELTALELRVARRADEIAGGAGGAAALKLHCWLLAEQEILRPAAPLEGMSSPTNARFKREAG